MNEQLHLALDAEEPQLDETARGELGHSDPVSRPAASRRPPRGIQVGDVVVVERSRWAVLGFDPEGGKFKCRLIGGSRALRHFRPRAIVNVERGDR